MGTERDTDPGDRAPAGRLDRAPGERYPSAATAVEPRGGPGRAAIAGAVVAVTGGLLLAALELLDLGAGLLAVAVAIGWATGIAIRWGAGPAGTATDGRRPRDAAASSRGGRALLAGVLAGAAAVLGLELIWLWSRTEGGVLGPLDYLGQRIGPLPALIVGLAVVAAVLRAR